MLKKLSYQKQIKTIAIGITEEKELIFVNIEIGSCDNNHFTITHDNYQGLIKESEGEDIAREYLEEGELWRIAVEAGNTTKGLDDWIEEVIAVDGWEQIIGDLTEIGNHGEENYFIRMSSCGADAIGNLKKKYIKLYITDKEREILIKSDKLHLKDFKKYTKMEKSFFESKILPLFDLFNPTSKKVSDFADDIPLLKED